MSKWRWNGTAALVAAALMVATVPATPARADSGDSSTGAAITVGLMVAVVAVYGLVALRADVDRYTQGDVDAAIARAAQRAEESPIVLQAVTAPMALEGTDGAGGGTEIAGATVGWRLTF